MSARESDLLRPRTIVDCIDDIRETVDAVDLDFDNYVYSDGVLGRTCRRSIDMLVLRCARRPGR